MKRFALVMLVVTFATDGPAAQDLERLFKAAVNTETVDRNCKGAIEQYTKVAAGSNRALTAQALLRMAGCHQQLGDDEAQRIYVRIVREYRDQPEVAAQAQTRLTPATSNQRRRDRVVQTAATTGGEGRVSPDGRMMSFVSWAGPKGLNLMLRDLVAKTDRALTHADWNSGSAGESTFSPDGKLVAYGWQTYEPTDIADLRVVAVADAGIAQPKIIYSNSELSRFAPTDWSRDGKTLAVRVGKKDSTNQIALVGTDGSYRPLKTVDGWQTAGKMFFSPDGKHLAYDLPASDSDPRRDLFVIAADGSGETAIHDPADDVIMGWSPDGRYLLFASDRSGRVDLWALPVSNGKPVNASPMLLKPDIDTVKSIGLTSAGAMYAVKDASNLSIQIAPIDLDQGRLTGPPFLQIFRTGTPAWSPDGRRLAYSVQGANGQAYLAVREMGSNRVREYRPRFVYMPDPRWFPDGQSLVVAGRDVKGRWTILRIDVDTGRETIIAPEVNGSFVEASRDGKKVYYPVGIFDADRSGALMEQDLTTGVKRELFTTPYGTGTSRFSPSGTMVAMIRTPVIDRKNSSAKASTVFVMPAAGGSPREIIVPAVLQPYRGFEWTPDGAAILVAAIEPKQLWLVPANGGVAQVLDVDIAGWGTGHGVRLHPNGKQIAYFTGEDAREVWALENVVPPSPK